jgi:hypothetical protein
VFTSSNEDKFTFSAVFELNDKAKFRKNGSEEQLLIQTEDLLMKKHRKESKQKKEILQKK